MSTSTIEGDQQQASASSKGNEAARGGHAAVLRAAGVLVTFVIAIWGAVTGTLAWQGDRHIAVEVAPAKPVLAVLTDHSPILFSIVNRSRHAVVLEQGEVWLEGRRVGMIDRVVQPASYEDIVSSRNELDSRAQLLPVIVAGETSVTAAALWTLERPATAFVQRRLVEANTLPEWELPRASETRLTARLAFDPGGERSVRVPVAQSARTQAAIEQGVRFGWQLELRLGQRGRIAAMVVHVPREETVDVGLLKVWTQTSTNPIRTLSHPISRTVGRFPLGWLKRGKYVWALGDGRRTIGTGSFVVPCPGDDPRVKNEYVELSKCA